jgi:hypothetical protein
VRNAKQSTTEEIVRFIENRELEDDVLEVLFGRIIERGGGKSRKRKANNHGWHGLTRILDGAASPFSKLCLPLCLARFLAIWQSSVKRSDKVKDEMRDNAIMRIAGRELSLILFPFFHFCSGAAQSYGPKSGPRNDNPRA